MARVRWRGRRWEASSWPYLHSGDCNYLKTLRSSSLLRITVIETLFAKMEQEQDKALEKIDFLENEDLREENLQVSEHQGKSFWDDRRQYGKGDSRVHEGVPLAWTAGYDDAEAPTPGDDPRASAEGFVEEAALEKRRYVALYQSTFSVVLSLLVGLIVWEAEDPCLRWWPRSSPSSACPWAASSTSTGSCSARSLPVLAQACARAGPASPEARGRLLRKIGFAS
ncbi:unnamed protein product [Spirodela intermedia]|uniref:Uncharacterized protein n=1 Tax=Spirodela intermedia TaxID=51605 RepID=A0A7I8JA47_SPIIN|nr:unnamed protein product [Spirodela intermedia]CAA6667098.1 unnamed protein product [Spirodela intermedia]